MRENGFYWVKTVGILHWEIAEYHNGNWYLFGRLSIVKDDYFYRIDKKVERKTIED